MQSPHSVTVRPATGADVAAWDAFVIAEQARTYAGQLAENFLEVSERYYTAEREARIRAFDAPGESIRLVAERNGRIVGVAEAGPGPEEWETEHGLVPAPVPWAFTKLYVHPDMHGTGLGLRLMDAVVGEREAYLWLIDGNARAQRFYERAGFRIEGDSAPAGDHWGNVPMWRMVRRKERA